MAAASLELTYSSQERGFPPVLDCPVIIGKAVTNTHSSIHAGGGSVYLGNISCEKKRIQRIIIDHKLFIDVKSVKCLLKKLT